MTKELQEEEKKNQNLAIQLEKKIEQINDWCSIANKIASFPYEISEGQEKGNNFFDLLKKNVKEEP